MNNKDREDARTLELLEAIEAKSDVTQRHLADRLDVALGLANSYLKRCVRKGLVKIKQAPANRYLYYLTPKGFAEKSRLTGQYLSSSFKFYRRAGDSCADALVRCKRNGWRRITLCGASDLAEIASFRALEHDIEIACVYDVHRESNRFLNYRLVNSIQECAASDGWMLTDLANPQETYERLLRELPAKSVIVPDILGVSRTA